MCCEGGSRAHHGNGDCSCSPGSSSPGTLTRRFSTQEEQVGALEEYLNQYGVTPKTIMMQNHGLIAVGRTASEVESITAMNVKACRVLLGAAAFGGPHFMTDEDVRRIYTHPGELYRRKLAGF